MKKLIVAIAIIVIMLSGCGGPIDAEPNRYNPSFSLFVTIDSGYHYEIVYHKDTKVMYVLGNDGDCTVMVDENGMSLLWED